MPGTEAWVNDPVEFREHAFHEKLYDPGTSLVAIDEPNRQFAGLVRIWASDQRARLGLIGVARPYRRRGLASALLAAALQPVRERGVREVMAEVDATNTAGLALLRGIGAVETGASVVLERPR